MKNELLKTNGREILYVDYRMKTLVEMEQTLLDNLADFQSIVANGEKIYVLVDIRNTPINKDFTGRLMRGAKEFIPHVAKSAIVGVTGIKRLYLEMYVLFTQSKMRPFSNKENALDYLSK